ncbi:MAG: DUF1648 domain-containing protein [Candidatus Lokiarchaeota archaeon]|nr:DUF1648 domain-containing protein [Candidatus Lokiarchaeota archaeon]
MVQNASLTQNIFRPEKSKGGFCFSTFFLILLIILMVNLIIVLVMNQVVTFIVLLIITSIMFIIFGVFGLGYYNMKYEFLEDRLLLKSGIYKSSVVYNTVSVLGKPNSYKLSGIRTNGVAIPGYLAGHFKIFFDGKLETVRLFVTKMNKLVLLRGKDSNGAERVYGVSPKDEEGFITALKSRCTSAEETRFDPEKLLTQDESNSLKYASRSRNIYYFSIILSTLTVLFIIVSYLFLPDIIPIHYNIVGAPDAWGNKISYFILLFCVIAFEVFFTLVFYHTFLKRSELRKTKYGSIIMIIPLSICFVFFILVIIFSIAIFFTIL